MRKFIFIFLLLLFPSVCFGGSSILCNESDEWYDIADKAVLTIPDSNWSVGVYYKLDDNSGVAFQYPISSGAFGAANSWNLALCEDGWVSGGGWVPGAWAWLANDGTDDATIAAETVQGGDGVWRLIVVQRSGNTVSIHYCVPGSACTTEGITSDVTALDAVDTGNWNICRRTDADADRYWGGNILMWYKADKAFSTDELAEIAINPTVYEADYVAGAFFMSAGANEIDFKDGSTATANNTPGDSSDGPAMYFGGSSN
ncbi:hypothetical protein KAR91_11210 [Candidatus Pacearchaeota archaeon]|nr:hypothetical protein [Candidatus Pacearchaeota archaeon]